MSFSMFIQKWNTDDTDFKRRLKRQPAGLAGINKKSA